MLRLWQKYLKASKSSGEPVFAAWHGAAGGNGIVQAGIAAKNPASRRELAAVYAEVLCKHDRAEPFSDPAAEQLRAVLRGPSSPADVPVAEFDSIYTEGDSNNLR